MADGIKASQRQHIENALGLTGRRNPTAISRKEMTMKYRTLELGTVEAVFNKLGGIEGAQAFLRDEITLSKPVIPPLLQLVTTAPVMGKANFAASDHFKTKKTPDGVKLSWIGDNFTTHFLGKMEASAALRALKFHTLKRWSLDAPILAELGEEAQETTLSELWALLVKSPQGENGLLLTNGYANIFYIRDTEGTLWAVYAYWRSGDGWYVGAFSVEGPDEWDDGCRVVSR